MSGFSHGNKSEEHFLYLFIFSFFLDALTLLIHEERVSSSRRQVELQRESG